MITPNMGITVPDDHTDPDTWGAALNTTGWPVIDSHNHTTGQGVPIPSAALRINADVAWSFAGTSFAATFIKAVQFNPQATSAVSGYAGALFINSANNELTYRTTAGVNVQVTSGAALNFAAFVGGIGGDYSAVSALESYDDATRRYLFQQEGGPRPWAGLATADIDLYQKAASIVNKVTLKSPNTLAASYTLAFPTGLPAAVSPAFIDTIGNITAGAPNNANLTLSGTGHIKRGAVVTTVPIKKLCSVNVSGGGVTSPTGGSCGAGNPASSTNAFEVTSTSYDNHLVQINSWTVYGHVTTANVTFQMQQSSTAGSLANIPGATATTASLVAGTPLVLTPTTPFDTTTSSIGGQQFWLLVTSAASAVCDIYSVDYNTSVVV